MPRIADTSKTLVITAAELHAHDYIIGANGETFIVDEARRCAGGIRVTVWRRGADAITYTLKADRLVTVATEHGCDCSGSGRFRWAGRVENGVYIGQEGPHFACAGKGWQDRSDVIRCATYWNKYARIAI